MPGATLTRPSTVETFLKETTGLRVGLRPVEVFLAQLETLGQAVAAKATGLAHADGNRATLLERDVLEAFQAVAGVGTQPGDPAGIFTQVDRLTTDQLAQLINHIRDWLAHPPRP
jgi:hypothetical protein